jgi:K+-transporting ATPase ATPase C chain
MWKTLWRACILFIGLTVLTGILYPLIVTGFSQIIFPKQANGSMVRHNGKDIGSSLIGQDFHSPKYFHGRPSTSRYDATASGGSNLAQTNKKLLQSIKSRVTEVRKEDQLSAGQKVPSDRITSSASGLDPDITPEGAMVQVHRIAVARGIDEKALRQLVNKYMEQPILGVFGSPRVNVLKLNLALDSLTGRR